MPPKDLSYKTIAEALSLEYGRTVTVRQADHAAADITLADSTLKFFAPTPEGEEGFMLLSGAGNPHLVGRAVDNIRTARAAVTPAIAAAILPPVHTGRLSGCDYAIWPLQAPFDTASRLRRKLRNRLYAGDITTWAGAFCHETQRPADPAAVQRDLDVILAHAAFPADMHADAETAVQRLRQGAWQPVHCLQHGDFWEANLLLPSRRGGAARFYVVDWAGMTAQGYPFLDLSRMLMSLRCGKGFSARQLEALRRRIGCEAQDVTAYILSAYGTIGQNLEYFPPDRYRAAALALYRFVKAL